MEPDRPPNPREGLVRSRLLHFDDEAAVRLAVAGFLRRLEVDVDGASTLGQAKDRIESTSYDVLISDLDPGSGDTSEGLDFIRWVRERNPELPILVLTGHDSDDLRSRARSLGVRDVLLKSHSLDRLERILREMFASRDGAEARPGSEIDADV
jgi:DNA-binding NarL/FixJ family response regulator